MEKFKLVFFVSMTNFLLKVMFVILFGIVLASPLILKFYLGLDFWGVDYAKVDELLDFSYKFLLSLVIVTGVFSLVIVFNLIKILKTVQNKKPFVRDNVKSLRKIAYSALAIAIFYSIKVFILNSVLTYVIILIFFMGAMFCIVLSEVFEQACIFKEENDLTI